MDTVAVMVRVSLGNNEMKLSLQNTGFTTSFVFSLCIFFIIDYFVAFFQTAKYI